MPSGAILMLAAALTTYVVANLNPVVIAMAEARARQLAVAAINRAVAQVMQDSVSYSDLIPGVHRRERSRDPDPRQPPS